MYLPLVSIIVPVYNVEKYLSQCLDSILSQTYKNLELICVNDGSTDDSASILTRYQKEYPQLKIISLSNQGVASARNIGLESASGELIVFVDADDWLEKEALESVYKIFEDSEIDFACFGSYKYQDEKNGLKRVLKKYSANEIKSVEDSWLLSIGIAPWGKIFRVSFLRTNNLSFPVGLFYEDIYFHWACISYAKKIAFFKSVLYYYRIREDSLMGLSKRKMKGRAIHHLFNLERIHDLWLKNGFLIEHKELFETLFDKHVQAGYTYLHDDENWDYVQKTKKCVETWKLKLKKITFTYDLVQGRKLSPTRYRWAFSIRKRIVNLKNIKILLLGLLRCL